MSWKTLPFEEVVQSHGAGSSGLSKGEWKKSGKFPVIGQGEELIEGWTDREDLVIDPGQGLVIYGGHTRRAKHISSPFVPGPNVKLLRPVSMLNSKFLYYFLNKTQVPSKGYADHFPLVRRIAVPIPPIKEQERIVALLEEAEELKRKRAVVDQTMTTVIPALFSKIFGNPGSTTFPIKKLIEIVDPKRPITYGILKPGPNIEDGIPYVRVLDIKYSHLHVSQLRKTTTFIANQYKRSILIPGDLLITIRGTVGRTCVVPTELAGANITQDTARIAVVSELESRYVMEFLNSNWAQNWMSRKMVGQAVKGINLGDLKELPVPIAPIKLQKKFVDQVDEFLAFEAKQKEATKNIDKLFSSILSQSYIS